VSRLAGGVAHDFNNILGLILGQAQMLLRRLPPEDPLRARVEQIVSASERAASLTHQLLAFSRKQVLETRVLELNEAMAGLIKMLTRLVGEDVEVTWRPGPDLGQIRADPTQLEQILMNLAVNARDAMPQGGRLAIETFNARMDEEYARVHAGATPGEYVCLAVSETGHGMTKEAQAQIFEPFFTTKEPGKGTGLGLATVYGIVKQSGGFVYVYSEPDQGTSFKVYFPRVYGDVEKPPEPPQPSRGSETVLLVEDEAALRELIRELLVTNGYKVLAAANPMRAIEAADAYEGVIHALLTDVVTPGMNGRELARRIQRQRPDIRIVYMSGYADDAIAQHGVLEPATSLITKPFTEESLTRKLRQALEQTPRERA